MWAVANHYVRTLSLIQFQPDILYSGQAQSVSDVYQEQHFINTN